MKSIWVLINDESLNWEQFSFVKATHWFVDSRAGPLSRNEWNRQCFPGVCNAFFLLAFGFVLNQLPGILLFICQVQFPSDFTQNSNVESPEINYLPCSISTALPLQAFYLPLTLHQVPQHFLENSWSLQRKCYTRKSDLPCVIHPTSRWVRKVTLLNCNLHFKDHTNIISSML